MIRFIYVFLLTTPILLAASCGAKIKPVTTNNNTTIKVNSSSGLSMKIPGQEGPTPLLLKRHHVDSISLNARRSNIPDKQSKGRWVLELFGDKKLLAQWPAVSGFANQQDTDRRWSPGNGAPLPIGSYQLGQPESWGKDIWMNLQPNFDTDRSGLGIHQCDPGNGCLCIPSRVHLEALASWVKATGIERLNVIN